MYSKLFKKMILPLLEKIYGTKVLKRLKFLEKSQYWSKEQLKAYQEYHLKKLISYAYEYVPYYRKLFEKNRLTPNQIKKIEDLKKIPILTKEIIKNNLQDLISIKTKKNALIEKHSSGSTGEPMKFYIDKSTFSWNWAATLRAWQYAGFQIGEPYVKLSLNPLKKIIAILQELFLRTTYIYTYDITPDTIEKYIDILSKIKNKKNVIIRGYASNTYALAKRLNEKRIKLNFKSIVTTGDILFPHYRKTIEEQFNCKVLDTYGGDGSVIANQCEMHNLFHNADENVITEIIKNNRDAKPNEMGEVVITNLYNYSMPFIRYNIKDVAVATDEECLCGRKLTAIKAIQGRDTDIVKTPNGSYLIVHFFTWLFEYIEGIDQFQVTQNKKDELTISIVKNEKYTKNDTKRIVDNIKKAGGSELKIKLNFVKDIPKTKSGKRRFVISNIKDTNNAK